MSSWFVDAIGDTLGSTIDKLKDGLESLPIKKETLEKLTLTTPELLEERKRLDEEERRKAHVKDALSSIFPWETKDEERDILVEECKEAILKLSSDESTFTGPFKMPDSGVVVDDSDDDKKKGDDNDDEDEDDVEANDDEDNNRKSKTPGPSEESLSKLTKLEPLPKLLDEFDIDTHVGLIQKVLEVDPQLVEMQSEMSGGGEREKIFWKNYFFHCAYTRYEAGLSIDEIWSDQQQATISESSTNNDPTKNSSNKTNTVSDSSNEQASPSEHDETITFEDPGQQQQATAPAKTTTTSAAATTTNTGSGSINAIEDTTASESALFDAVASVTAENETTRSIDDSSSPLSNDGSEYEMIGGTGDPELDELEAEIAKELED